MLGLLGIYLDLLGKGKALDDAGFLRKEGAVLAIGRMPCVVPEPNTPLLEDLSPARYHGRTQRTHAQITTQQPHPASPPETPRPIVGSRVALCEGYFANNGDVNTAARFEAIVPQARIAETEIVWHMYAHAVKLSSPRSTSGIFKKEYKYDTSGHPASSSALMTDTTGMPQDM